MGKKTRIVAIANEKGGVGKTATVVNLGAALSLAGQQVLVIDMDPQHNSTNGLGIAATDDSIRIYDLFTHGQEYKVRDASCHTTSVKLDSIPSHIDLSGSEFELVDE